MEKEISVVNVFTNKFDLKSTGLISQNYVFLQETGITYFVLDCLEEYKILNEVRVSKKISYLRTNGKSMKELIALALDLANSETVYIFFGEVIFSLETIDSIESKALKIKKGEIYKIRNLPNNFDLEDFKILTGSKKSILERIKISFKYRV